MFDYTKPEPDGQGMWKIEEMMKCFLAPAFLLLGGHSLTLRTSAANAIMLLKHHPEFKSPKPRFPRQYCGPIQTDGFRPTAGDFSDPGGSCENRRGQIINHQATDEAVTPSLDC